MISSSSGTGDADLYVLKGSAPTTANHDCRPYLSGNDETCTFAEPAAGLWYINLNGYKTFSGVTLTASYEAEPTTSNIPDMCAIQGPQSRGKVQDGSAICLGNISKFNPSWLSIGDVSGHNSIAISTAHGTGDLALEFSNLGWPDVANHQDVSYKVGNNKCVYLTNLDQYWGYIKISVASDPSEGASLVVDFDTAGCR